MSLKTAGKTSFLVLVSMIFSPYSAFAGSVPTVQQLNIGAGEIANWIPDTAMKTYADTQLYNLLDGGAPLYLDKGCLVTGFQRFSGPDGTQAESKIMDFGKDSNATAIFKEMQGNNIGQNVADQDFPDSTVCVVPNMGGVTGYAHFSNIYIEITTTGFSDQQVSISALNLFLGFFKNKIKNIEKAGVHHASPTKFNADNASPYREVFLLEGRHSQHRSSSSKKFNIRGQQLGKIQTMQLIIIKER